MTINHNGAITRALAANTFESALASAEKVAGYQPLDPSQHARVGFIAYLAGKRDRALSAFDRAKQLTLPAQFKAWWDAQAARPGYGKVIEDKAFVDRVFAGPFR